MFGRGVVWCAKFASVMFGFRVRYSVYQFAICRRAIRIESRTYAYDGNAVAPDLLVSRDAQRTTFCVTWIKYGVGSAHVFVWLQYLTRVRNECTCTHAIFELMFCDTERETDDIRVGDNVTRNRETNRTFGVRNSL